MRARAATPSGRTSYPNRNYGVEWGGPGTNSNFNTLTYAGPGPFSEPETQALRDFVRDLQVTVLITNHTYTGLILRPPGTGEFGPVPDEQRLRALGDAMAAETDYISQFSYQLYDTTGTTDDYLYDGLNAFSYTPEIGKAEFHPEYTQGFIPEYDGRPEEDEFGNPTGEKLGGLREAFTLAGLTAINADSHSVLAGTAPAGRTLRLTKSFTYETSSRPDDDPEHNPDQPKRQSITEPRTSTMVVPATGRLEWHVNPSSQPRKPEAAWNLECLDGSGNVLETRQVFVARAQTVNLALACGGAAPAGGQVPVTGTTCTLPNGFRSVGIRRRGSGLRITFSKRTRNPATIAVFQTSKGRKIVNDKRVALFATASAGSPGTAARRAGRSGASRAASTSSASA